MIPTSSTLWNSVKARRLLPDTPPARPSAIFWPNCPWWDGSFDRSRGRGCLSILISSVQGERNDYQCTGECSGSGRHRSSHRSEEHTSELQSLMRISYAVFGLKKTNIQSPN